MTKIFIAGSRRISRLNADLKRRIDTLIEKGFTILIGDAKGADSAVQQYLAEKRYRNVIVYCMIANCRNNVANWPTRQVQAPPGTHGFAYYAAKDEVMADEAECGLMLWDGESKGTLNGMINMVRQNKPIVVYLAPQRSFHDVHSSNELNALLAACDNETVRRLGRELGLELTPK